MKKTFNQYFKNNLFNLSLIGLTILSFMLLFLVKSQHPAHSLKAYLEKKPQEYMRNAFVTLFTEGGVLKNELSAKYWAYLPEKKKSTFTMPHLTIYKPDGTLWHMDAQKGEALQPNIGAIEKIILQNNVILNRLGSKIADPIQVNTEAVDYYPKKQYAENNTFVKMNKPGLIITGVGLRAFLENGAVELLQNVKTYYTVHP
jgi:lipopolysaccharide export system protein LptC